MNKVFVLLVPITRAVKKKPGRCRLSQALGRIIPRRTCRCQWVDGAPGAPPGPERPGLALPPLIFDLGVLWFWQRNGLPWFLFRVLGRSKRFIYNTGCLQINCINSLAVIFSFQSVFEVRDSMISYSASVRVSCTPGAVQG